MKLYQSKPPRQLRQRDRNRWRINFLPKSNDIIVVSLLFGIAILTMCFFLWKPKNTSAASIDLAVMNNSLNNEKIDVEVFINDTLFFKKKEIESFYDGELKLAPGNYILKVNVKNKNLSDTARIAVEGGNSYMMTFRYTYQPSFDTAKFIIVQHAIKNRVIRQTDSSLFLKELEKDKPLHPASPRKIKIEFVNRKSIHLE